MSPFSSVPAISPSTSVKIHPTPFFFIKLTLLCILLGYVGYRAGVYVGKKSKNQAQRNEDCERLIAHYTVIKNHEVTRITPHVVSIAPAPLVSVNAQPVQGSSQPGCSKWSK